MSVINPVFLLFLLVAAECWAGDPTRPPNLEPAASEIINEPLRLSMILQERERRVAVINGKVLAVRERIGTAQLLAINTDHVVLVRSGQKIILRMPGGAVKQVSKGETNE